MLRMKRRKGEKIRVGKLIDIREPWGEWFGPFTVRMIRGKLVWLEGYDDPIVKEIRPTILDGERLAEAGRLKYAVKEGPS